MERVIKFRVWNQKDKEFSNFSPSILNDSRKRNFWLKRKNCIIQQFTGLIDYKGKEVYEGDLIRIQYDEGEFVQNLQWTDYVNEVIWVNEEHRFGIIEHKRWGNKTGHLPWDSYPVKVVGNIFEYRNNG